MRRKPGEMSMWGGGAGTGCATFWGAFFEQNTNLRVSLLAKSQVVSSHTLIKFKFHSLR